MSTSKYTLDYIRVTNTGAVSYDIKWHSDFFVVGAFEETLTTPAIVVEIFNNSYNSMIAGANRMSSFANINGILDMADTSKINLKEATLYLPNLTIGINASILVAYLTPEPAL